MRIKRLNLIASLLSIIVVAGCSDTSKHHVDLTNSEVEVRINRLEDDIFSVRNVEDYKNLDKLDSNFIHVFKRGIMGTETRDGFIPVEASADGLIKFVTNDEMMHLYKTADSTYPEIDWLEEELSEAFSYYHYHFPEKIIPSIYTVVTPFRSQVITTENAIGIGLDMYLGAQFGPYQSPGLEFPQYLINRFRKDYIVPNVMRGWLESEYTGSEKNRLLDEMIFQGKVLYALDALLPDTPDSLKIGYAQGKIEWCYENEKQIWSHLIEADLLYSTEYRKYTGMISDGPFSKGMNVPQESPPKIGVWAGWQIVREYMDKHPETELQELFDNISPDELLRKSGYKP